MTTSETSVLTTSDRDVSSFLVGATAALFTTALLGSLLVGPQIAGYHAFWFRLFLPVYAIGFGWLVWVNRQQFRSPSRSLVLFTGFGGFVALSALWASDTGRMIFGLWMLLSGLFLAGAIYGSVVLTSRRAIWQYLAVITSLVAISEVVALVEIFTGYHLPPSRLATDISPELKRVGVDMASAWFYNRNNFSFFLALASGPLFAVASIGDRPTHERGTLYGIVALAAFVIWANGSAAPLLMTGIAIGTVLFLSAVRIRRFSWTLPRNGAKIVTAGMFLAAAVCVVAIVLLPNPFTQTADGNPLWTRWQLAEAAVEMFIQSNGVGVGVGSFPPTVEALPVETGGTLSSHNWLLYLFGEFGIIGAALFLAAYAHLLFDLFERTVNTGNPLQIGFFAALFALPIGALSPSNALYTYSFWLFIGLAASVALAQEGP